MTLDLRLVVDYDEEGELRIARLLLLEQRMERQFGEVAEKCARASEGQVPRFEKETSIEFVRECATGRALLEYTKAQHRGGGETDRNRAHDPPHSPTWPGTTGLSQGAEATPFVGSHLRSRVRHVDFVPPHQRLLPRISCERFL